MSEQKNNQNQQPEMNLSQLLQVRRDKLKELKSEAKRS